MIVAGTNSDCRDERRESDEKIRVNIQGIIDTITKEDPNIYILLSTPPPIRDNPEYKIYVENGQESRKVWREQERIAQIARVVRGFAGPNVGICDLFKELSERPGKWHIDQVHLTDSAEEVWADLVIKELEAGGVSNPECNRT